MDMIAGVDIGGTKCAVCLGEASGEQVKILRKQRFPTPTSPQAAMDAILHGLNLLLKKNRSGDRLKAIGVSCGGPLDAQAGIVLSPPNLANWDHFNVITPLRERFDVPTGLQNDANASALAEWKWGAGRRTKNMIFLTFGTGMGAGLILDGRLYPGVNDMAGEVGHIRMAEDGPLGYGKAGSLEGFCSGGGIARLGQRLALEGLQRSDPPSFCPTFANLPDITAEKIGEAAQRGDPLARDVFERVGTMLGRGLALLVDLLNPECIVIGSIYRRQRELIEPAALRVLQQEALALSLSVCRVVPSELGENLGDFASLSVAIHILE